ncbi:MAG: hypothetical protein CO189_11360 [candidate division Zixibacteria bacterium CG_4_9_14_3_um_filter_46_8]|nr:MAG: hypothetical protein CO189_11360 [candidate division Zixibacteria bacterium CG_4_9_14_3_um_filter_46_8]
MEKGVSKLFIIGIDGGDPDFILGRLKKHLPNINKLAGKGTYGTVLSTIPPATIPAWNSFYTGLNPGGHGLYDFTTPPDYHYRVHFINSRHRKPTTFWQLAGNAGKRCAVLNFPSCYPPEKIQGIMISGFDCPLPSGADRSFIEPQNIYDEIIKCFGPYRISGFDQVNLEPATMSSAAQSLLETAEYKAKVAEWLLKKEKWDLFMVHFGEVDAACHHFWRYYDSNSPRRRGDEGTQLAEVIPNVYSKIDEMIGLMMNYIDDKWAVLLISDHGFSGTSRNVFHLNNLLQKAGLLSFKHQGIISDSFVKKALKYLPVPARKYFFRGLLSKAADRIEGIRRCGNIDFSGTKAFSEELNYFPSVRLNLKGKYHSGNVARSDSNKVLKEVESALRECYDLDGNPIIKNTYRAEEIYFGQYVDQAPDLIIEMNNPGGYINGLLPSSIGGPMARELKSEEYAGGKGSFPCGGHRRQGFYIFHNAPYPEAGDKELELFDFATFIHYILDIKAMELPDG